MTQFAKALRRWLRPLSPRPRLYQLHQLLFRREILYSLNYPIASFTFDDFPRSALRNGGRLLKDFNARGTYYTSLGLMNTDHPTQGPCFTREDLDSLIADGHEVGCHTYAHIGAKQKGLATFEGEILRNRQQMQKFVPGYELENFAYPGGEITFRLKRRMHSLAASSRSCYAGVNRPTVDLDALVCQHMRMDRPIEDIKKVLGRCGQVPGWLIFYTHDVSEAPSCGGCTPEYFEGVLKVIAASCRILTVRDALKQIRESPGAFAPISSAPA